MSSNQIKNRTFVFITDKWESFIAEMLVDIRILFRGHLSDPYGIYYCNIGELYSVSIPASFAFQRHNQHTDVQNVLRTLAKKEPVRVRKKM